MEQFAGAYLEHEKGERERETTRKQREGETESEAVRGQRDAKGDVEGQHDTERYRQAFWWERRGTE